ncbi:MAG: hypothetical protein IPP71_07150 [Bacteroidetes bacterium]|nr:hypothetical protein [Bacteroidota bacterium]
MFAKTGGGSDQDEVLCIKATNTGGFIIGGQTHQQNGVNLKGFLINTDGSGNVLWSKTYDTPANELFYSVYALSDGGFAAIGISSVTSGVNEKMIVVKVNASGAFVWSKSYQDAVTYGFDIYETPNHRLLLAGTTKHTTAYSGLLINADSTGTILWRKEYTPSGSTFATRFNTLRPTSDGGFILEVLISRVQEVVNVMC